ncbi:hypothetical protein BKA67DRAFT_373788 [Truncatella angustata]|uniref:Uncharacterized protein n=1 Tax=Truncatella angustata TaxID=152316 RepID=A0A9P8UF50_9PEZI|nr:uncharacterized protein BKA67DRAFT_373788 [Truncatella angustata]KAH6648826.1 hypothetical protein BKA67DRAFT_373788 [Truncatella angustata]KAH8200888.1 hypothetical protein TruAng_004974 [Truncatella angustata]
MPTEYIRVRSGHVPEIVRSNSFSYRHHHHHRRSRCHDDCCGVSWTDYNNLLEQNRKFSQQNEELSQEKDTLKADLNRATQANKAWSEDAVRWNEVNGRLSGEVERLSGEIHILQDELARCRRSWSPADDHQIHGFKRRIKALEHELRDQEKTFSAEIRGLKEDVKKSNDVASQWKRKYDELKRLYDSIRDSTRRQIFERDAQLERRGEIIQEQSHTIRRLKDLLERYRGW